MSTLEAETKTFEIDEQGFLVDPQKWDAEFALAIAPEIGILGGLTDEHWRVITYIRDYYMKTGQCPMVHEMGKSCGLRLANMKRLFPAGYLRGACKIAGLTYSEEEVHSSWLPNFKMAAAKVPLAQRVYRVNYRGFLLDAEDWDEEYAVFKAREIGIPELTKEHWQVIRFLRKQFEQTGKIPSVYETCEENGLELEDLGRLFPSGYHRGAVKISGLRQR